MDDETRISSSTPIKSRFCWRCKNRPAPISEAEVQKIVAQMQQGADKPRHKVEFVVGEYIRVKEGPFTDFNGTVEEVNYEKTKCGFRSRSSVVPRLLSWNSIRSKRPEILALRLTTRCSASIVSRNPGELPETCSACTRQE